uniref:Uncharacterized protein LOC111138293 n=1 Tax=Crassostrea virginica TaxID=6565 RepID=A0A8B8F0T8_CRAVI|nr:uncharacterized protein LOC111138293 [Crassostrea virginica]XP_022345879.1 uncharacterized protein LOC111138293 [Crassostrea virginica]
MGSGGSKTQSSDQKPVPSSNDYKSHTVGTAPKDTNANSGGQSTNESTAASERSTNQKTIDQKTLAPPKQTESQGSEPKEIKKQVEEDPSRVESSTANQKKEEETNKTDPPPVSQTKQADSAMPKPKASNTADSSETDRVIPELSRDQQLFDDAISSACQLVRSQSLIKLVTPNVTSLCLQRALPQGFSLYDLLLKMTSLQDLDLSHNDIGPQGFRSICLAMCMNTSIVCLNLSDSKTDTDSAECLGLMLSHNGTMSYLNISNNYFGKDYFSRCVGPALKTNTALTTFRAENIGTTDIKDFIVGLRENTSLTELDFSNNCITDRAVLGSALGEILKRGSCGLVSLALAGCEMNPTGASHLLEGLKGNSSLAELNVNGLEFESLSQLLHFVAVAASIPTLQVLSIDGAKIKDTSLKPKGKQSQWKDKKCVCNTKEVAEKFWGSEGTKGEGQTAGGVEEDPPMEASEEDASNPQLSLLSADMDLPQREAPPSLQVLSLIDSHLCDEFFTDLHSLYCGRQIPLTEVDVSSNNNLTAKCVHSLAKITTGEQSQSTLKKLRLGLCSGMDSLPQELLASDFPCLQYLNVRKSKLTEMHTLSQLFIERTLTTLILDGQKIANTDTLEKLLSGAAGGHLSTLSISSCALTANDIKPLYSALKQGMKLQMLKLAGNRLEDPGVVGLAEALAANKTHPLAVLDVSDNTFGDEAAKQLAGLFTHKKHKTQIHSLNISHNCVGKPGLLAVVSAMGGKSPLRTLYLQTQNSGSQLTEPDMIELYTKLAQNLGFTIKKTGEKILPGCSDLPKLPEGLVVRMTDLGGLTGDIGQMLDSVRIKTDSVTEKPPLLTYSDVLKICAVLKGSGSDVPLWSSLHWKLITGLNRPTADAPSWLELPASRDLCLYLSNLPGNSTTQKLEAILEMDADCNLEEVCLMKDPVTRGVNGVGWALMSDEQSIQKALDFYDSGEAKVFGQSFVMSRVKVKVDDDEDSKASQKAQEDLELRLKLRQREEREHQRLIQRTTEESWKRHAYRLAHPAYADGRIW